MRDDLYAPGFFDPVLRRLVTEARRRGAGVEVGAGFAPGAADGRTGLLLRELTPRLAAGGKLGGFSANGGVTTKLKLLAIEGWKPEDAPALFPELPLVAAPRRRM